MDPIERNISAIHNLRIRSDEGRRLDQKFVDSVAAFMGSTNSLYLHAAFYGACFLIRSVTQTSLSLVASLEAIFLAIFVLINQRRMNAIARKHGDLQLQMTLLTEHEVTKLAQTTDAIAKAVGVTFSEARNLSEVKKEVHPNDVLKRLSEFEAKAPTASTNDTKTTDL